MESRHEGSEEAKNMPPGAAPAARNLHFQRHSARVKASIRHGLRSSRSVRHWIRDRNRTPRRPPLHALVEQLRQVVGASGCELFVHTIRGPGARLREWERQLDQKPELPISFQRLLELSGNTQDALTELDAECVGRDTRIRFGVHAGAALFIEAPPQMARRVLDAFKDIHPDPDALDKPRGVAADRD
jgi:hypothetical protein